MSHDYVAIALAYNKSVRIYAANSTKLVAKAQKFHQTLPTASAALGRFLTVTALMSLMDTNDERISIRIIGDGPIVNMTAEAKAGQVKGYINNPNVYLVYEDGPKKGKLNVGAAVGSGLIYVTKHLGLKEPFTSSSELVSGEIGDDFTYYFAASEQIPSSVGLGVAVGPKNKILYAGGYILQVLPNCPDDIIDKMEAIITNIPPITDLLKQGLSPERIIGILAGGTEEILETKLIAYKCDCSKAKFKKSLELIPIDALIEMRDEDHGAHIKCNFCNKEYDFTVDELTNIIHKKQKNSKER